MYCMYCPAVTAAGKGGYVMGQWEILAVFTALLIATSILNIINQTASAVRTAATAMYCCTALVLLYHACTAA